MGWLDAIFRRPPKTTKQAPTLDGGWPYYGQNGADVYASDVVQQALKCIVDEVKKLNPQHVRYKGSDPTPVRGNVQDVLTEPNEIMTSSEFLEKVTWLLLLNYNAFIIPDFYTWTDEATGQERRYLNALYPIQPTTVDFIEDAGGRLFVQFRFLNGDTTTIPYSDVIHIRYNYSVNQYMGGNMNGQPDHRGLLDTLELNAQLLHGVAKAMQASYAVNGVIKYNTMLDDGKMAENLNKLHETLRRGTSGILPIDVKADYTPIQRNAQLVDKDTLAFIDEKILRNFGVPLCILEGDYTKEQYEAFYQKTLEPLILSIGQALTKKIFTQRERAFGNKIELYPKALIFLSVGQTLEMINALAPTGALYENEKRTALGLQPLPELEGKRFMSLNWIDANNANLYQVGKDGVNVDIVDEEKEDI